MNDLAGGVIDKRVAVSKWCYWTGPGDRVYRANCMAVSVGVIDLYYSYNTVVAFRAPGYGLIVSENDWGSTTGRHLNAINPDHKARLSREVFEAQLSECLASYNLAVG